MLRTAGELKGVTIEATDGDIGGVYDLYFDDTSWTVRYLVVDTGTWLPGRQVLISPFAFHAVLGASRLKTTLSKDQVENSPSIDTDRPVNRQREIEYSRDFANPHLPSARDLMGYYIHATDGDLGHVEDFLVDESTWTIAT